MQKTWVSVSVLLLARKPSSEIMTVIFPLSVPAVTLLMKRRKSPAFFISLTTNMPIGLYLSILKPFIIPLGFTDTATICLLMILKNCLRGYLLCQQLSWQNFSFYFVLNLDTGPKYFNHSFVSPCFALKCVIVTNQCRTMQVATTCW